MNKTDPAMKIKRLYDAAKLLRGVEGQSNVSRLLGISPQTLAGWEKRGISQKGLIACQQLLGVSISWLESAEGEMTSQATTVDSPPPITPMFIETKATWPFEKVGQAWVAELERSELKTLELAMVNCLLEIEKNRETTNG